MLYIYALCTIAFTLKIVQILTRFKQASGRFMYKSMEEHAHTVDTEPVRSDVRVRDPSVVSVIIFPRRSFKWYVKW